MLSLRGELSLHTKAKCKPLGSGVYVAQLADRGAGKGGLFVAQSGASEADGTC